MDNVPARRRADGHLRWFGEISRGGRAADYSCRERVRIGLVAGLGGERAKAAGSARGDCGELRTDSPQQPGGHGNFAIAVQGRAEPRGAGIDGKRNVWKYRGDF